MEHDRSYYHDLAVYELKTRKCDFSAFLDIIRMVNNPSILAKQEVVFSDSVSGYYVVKVTEAVLETMKKVVTFEKIERVEDADKAFDDVWHKAHHLGRA